MNVDLYYQDRIARTLFFVSIRAHSRQLSPSI